jgi:hypothetical protein
VSAGAELETALIINAVLFELGQLIEHARDINDSAIAHQVDAFVVQDTAREQVEGILVSISDYSVPCVGATIEAGAKIEVLCENIYKFAFAFIAPLAAQDDGESRLEAINALGAGAPEISGESVTHNFKY